MADRPNKYTRTVWYWDEGGVKHAVPVDVYDVLAAFGVTCPAIAHAVKKLLCPGKRGHKDRATDLTEAIASIERAVEWAADAAPAEPLDIPAPIPREYRQVQCNICGNPNCPEPNQKH